jgi:hypothetical protein
MGTSFRDHFCYHTLVGNKGGHQHGYVEQKMPLQGSIEGKVPCNRDALLDHQNWSVDGVCLGVINLVAARLDNLLHHRTADNLGYQQYMQ